MYIVGLTGQIACGKSSVALVLQSLGAVVINADDLGREVVEKSKAIQRQLKTAFGSDIIASGGKIDRRKLARRAFANETNTEKLNSIVHPALLAGLRRQISDYRRSRRNKLVVIDAALIFNWRLDRELDVVVVVDSSRRNQLARLEKQGISRRDALHRISRQIPKYRLRKMADAVIHNNGSSDDLINKTWRLYARLVRHSGQKFD